MVANQQRIRGLERHAELRRSPLCLSLQFVLPLTFRTARRSPSKSENLLPNLRLNPSGCTAAVTHLLAPFTENKPRDTITVMKPRSSGRLIYAGRVAVLLTAALASWLLLTRRSPPKVTLSFL